jgi:hypothetical protein
VGLRLEISCESDKKKMNLIFNYDKKFPLTENEARVSAQKKETVCEKISREAIATDSESSRRRDFAADCLRTPS